MFGWLLLNKFSNFGIIWYSYWDIDIIIFQLISDIYYYIVVDTSNEKLETYFARGGSQLTGMKRK